MGLNMITLPSCRSTVSSVPKHGAWLTVNILPFLCFFPISLAFRWPKTCSLSKKLNWMVLRHWREWVIQPLVFSKNVNIDIKNVHFKYFKSFSLRGRPNLFYFDFIKCATSVNVMATALNGFQCPTMQVKNAAFVVSDDTGRLTVLSQCPSNNHLFSLPIGVRGELSLSVLGCGVWVIFP